MRSAHSGAKKKPLEGLLESFDDHWRLAESLWIVGYVGSATGLANELGQRLEEGDLLLVQQLTEESAWWGYTPEGDSWLRDRAHWSTRRDYGEDHRQN
jgi:hypothetical protein